MRGRDLSRFFFSYHITVAWHSRCAPFYTSSLCSDPSPFGACFYDTMNIYFCFLCQNCMWRHHGFAYICQIFITLPTHFHMHIQRHTHTSIHVQSAHKWNSGNQAQEPGWEGRKIGFVRDLTHTQCYRSESSSFNQTKSSARSQVLCEFCPAWLEGTPAMDHELKGKRVYM